MCTIFVKKGQNPNNNPTIESMRVEVTAIKPT